MKKILIRALVCSAVMVIGATSAMGDPTEWGGGTCDGFTYANGQDINGFFGAPFVNPAAGTFSFTNSNFNVASQNGAPDPVDHQTDTVSFDIVCDPGLYLGQIRMAVYGQYAVSDDASVTASGGLAVGENGSPGWPLRDWSADMVPTPTMPITAGNGTWDGLKTLDLSFETPLPYSELHIEMSTDVLAWSSPGGGSGSIDVNFQYCELILDVVPEPSSLALVALGSLALLRRRR